jgi:hypothetical protein
MKGRNRINTSLIDFVRQHLWCAEPSAKLRTLLVGDCTEDDEYKEYLRFQMYHLLVTNYLVNMTMLGKLTESMLDKYLEQGSSKKGLESLAATLLLESCMTAPFPSAEDISPMVEVIEPYYVQDNGEPSQTVFLPCDKSND